MNKIKLLVLSKRCQDIAKEEWTRINCTKEILGRLNTIADKTGIKVGTLTTFLLDIALNEVELVDGNEV